MDTIPEFAPESISMLRLDTDWYESTRHELEYLFPRLEQHGILIIENPVPMYVKYLTSIGGR